MEIPPRILHLLAAREMAINTSPMWQAYQQAGDGPIDVEVLNHYVRQRRDQIKHLDDQLIGMMRHA